MPTLVWKRLRCVSLNRHSMCEPGYGGGVCSVMTRADEKQLRLHWLNDQSRNLTESESRGPSLLRINYAVRFGRQQGGAGMNLRLVDRSKSRFAAYVEGLVSVIGHADQASPLRDYC